MAMAKTQLSAAWIGGHATALSHALLHGKDALMIDTLAIHLASIFQKGKSKRYILLTPESPVRLIVDHRTIGNFPCAGLSFWNSCFFLAVCEFPVFGLLQANFWVW